MRVFKAGAITDDETRSPVNRPVPAGGIRVPMILSIPFLRVDEMHGRSGRSPPLPTSTKRLTPMRMTSTLPLNVLALSVLLACPACQPAANTDVPVTSANELSANADEAVANDDESVANVDAPAANTDEPAANALGPVADAGKGGKLCSPRTSEKLGVEFINNSSQPVSFHWMEPDCAEGGGPSLAPGQRENGISSSGSIWLARGEGDQVLRTFTASADAQTFVVDDALIARIAREGEPYTEGNCSPKTEGRFKVGFINHLNEPVRMQWIGFDCTVQVLRTVPANGKTEEMTYPGHIFRFVDSVGRQLVTFDVSPDDEQPYHVSDD